MWKVGIVGAGYWSEKHFKAWVNIPQVQIAAICDRFYANAAQKAEQFGISEACLYTDMDEMLDRADIDIVDIVTAPDTHKELIGKAARAGKHILCQKPFAASLEDAEEMVAAAREAGVRLMVSEMWRWMQPFQAVKKALDEDRLGTLRIVRYSHSSYFTDRLGTEHTVSQPYLQEMPRLLFYEMGVHWFDVWRYLFGEPDRLFAHARSFSPHVKGEDSGVVVLMHEGFYGLMDMSWATRRELNTETADRGAVEAIVIDGDKATLKLLGSGDVVIVGNDGVEQVLERSTTLNRIEGHTRMQSHFIDCLESGAPFQTSGEDNLRSLKLTFAVYESLSRLGVVEL